MEFSRHIRLALAYDGQGYQGWQKQPNGVGVQNHLELVLQKVFNQPIKTVGSGRTDTGVHALDQNVHFDLTTDPQEMDLVYTLNRLLPEDIRVQRAWRAPHDFHALSSATHKTYRFRILQRAVNDPLRRGQVWWVPQRLNLSHLTAMAEILIGEHDFKSFQSKGTLVATTVRKVHTCTWTQHEDELIFTINGDGFLKQMVRNLVGTMIQILADKARDPQSQMREILAAQDRRRAAAPSPPQGLTLIKVYYPPQMEQRCTPIARRHP